MSFLEPLPAWLDLMLMMLLGFGLLSLWASFAHWRKTRSTLVVELAGVKADVAEMKQVIEQTRDGIEQARNDRSDMKRDIVGVRHDINAVGHTVHEVAEQLGTDIVESEERIVGKVDKLIEAQGVLLQQIATRPCMIEEAARAKSCPEGEG